MGYRNEVMLTIDLLLNYTTYSRQISNVLEHSIHQTDDKANSNKPVQVYPSPVNPVLQVQAKYGTSFVQLAYWLQLCDPVVHSFVSEKKRQIIKGIWHLRH